jgi:hypothetical protein
MNTSGLHAKAPTSDQATKSLKIEVEIKSTIIYLHLKEEENRICTPG